MRVLIYDDSPYAIAILLEYFNEINKLLKKKIEIIRATNWREFLIHNEKPRDFSIVDFRLDEGKTAQDVYPLIKSGSFVLSTGYRWDREVMSFLENMSGYLLHKPFYLHEVEKMVTYFASNGFVANAYSENGKGVIETFSDGNTP